ncbi:hypothetical protein [Streptomyces violascens]|uniref:hypothetical protein n=1 Tax=Streptomyces violascens TaxID=67381 RepID=UPI00364DFDE1
MNLTAALDYSNEILEANANHPAGSVDLTAALPGERTEIQAKSGVPVKTLTISYWHCC